LRDFSFEPGQIIFLSIPNFGEAPFAPCNPPGQELELCVRKVGKITDKIHRLKIGDNAGIRGPFGIGWPGARRQAPSNLLMVVGGLGLIPLRNFIWGKEKFLPPETKTQIFYGAKNPDEFLFKNDFEEWKNRGVDIKLTIDKECQGWNDCVGLVTTLFDKNPVNADSTAFLCGPPIMYKFVLEKMKSAGVPDENIYLSLERRMHCGVGVCQHCAVGSFYTCKDGPVFKYADIKNIPGAI
jgi:NAD(P)H-flavin reductase